MTQEDWKSVQERERRLHRATNRIIKALSLLDRAERRQCFARAMDAVEHMPGPTDDSKTPPDGLLLPDRML